MVTHVQKQPLDYSNAHITVVPPQKTPRVALLTQVSRQRQLASDPEFQPESTSNFDKIDNRSDWDQLCAEIQSRLKSRGFVKDVDYIGDYLSRYANELQDEIDAEDEAERSAEIAEFNLHISKLKPEYAAILVLRIREHWTFSQIGKLANICDQQADNLFQDAEKYFNSDLMQVDFIGHHITFDSSIDELISVLVEGANPVKSPAGRKPKPKKSTTEVSSGDLFQGVL